MRLDRKICSALRRLNCWRALSDLNRSWRVATLSFPFGINCPARHPHGNALPAWRWPSARHVWPASLGSPWSPDRILACPVFFWLALAFVLGNNAKIVLSNNLIAMDGTPGVVHASH